MIAGKVINHYNPENELTLVNIYKKITDWDIFHFYIPGVCLNRCFNSRLRKDKNPSVAVKQSKNGHIYYIDYSTGDHCSSVQYVKKLFNLDFNESLQRINNDFGLGLIGGKLKDYRSITSTYMQPQLESQPKRFDVWIRDFNQDELNYLRKFHLENANKIDIYGISKWMIDSVLQPNIGNLLTLGIFYPATDTWKIYKPHGDKKNKWKTNTTITTMYNLSSLDLNKDIFITKSRKEFGIFIKFLENLCTCENESPHSISKQVCETFVNSGRNIYLLFDNDKAGKAAADYYIETYGNCFKYLSIPDEYVEPGVKDFGEFNEQYGDLLTERIFKNQLSIIKNKESL